MAARRNNPTRYNPRRPPLPEDCVAEGVTTQLYNGAAVDEAAERAYTSRTYRPVEEGGEAELVSVNPWCVSCGALGRVAVKERIIAGFADEKSSRSFAANCRRAGVGERLAEMLPILSAPTET